MAIPDIAITTMEDIGWRDGLNQWLNQCRNVTQLLLKLFSLLPMNRDF
jgi:hypothetical protein